MNATLKRFLKDITDEELISISTYMMHVDELNK